MNVALLHYRGGLMDGVSLEMEKWKKVLEKLGHKVDIVAGNNNNGVDVYIKEIGFETPEYKLINKNSFEKLEDFSENELIELIDLKSTEILHIFNEKLSKYDIIISNNVWSLGAYLPVAIALKKYADKNKEKIFISHHHDFWWEREYFLHPTTEKIKELLIKYCPSVGNNIKHVVINSFAKDELYKRKNINSTIVPNVMNFDEPFEVSKILNNKIRQEFNIPSSSVVFLQATRITRRKAIELAIDLMENVNYKMKDYVGKKLYNDEIYNGENFLVFSGMSEDEEYKNELYKKAEELNVKIIDMYDFVEKGIWSFWDIYSVSDIITYPSILEGWGNQLLEAIIAKKPVVLFEYDVFLKDIKFSGLEYISLGNKYIKKNGLMEIDNKILEDASNSIIKILFDKNKYFEMVNKNFGIGKKEFGFKTLEEIIKRLLNNI
ncbi:Glycosyltransferase involved in cell wall bisynthesis [Marinitoga hydrogenitolerans DSM 16785]|uniref:Glycosyltransferase involved in cell wall bisynthesis n=1 Tax=Marinitoga hydrogenitolerans (strain DSM 16785 / JCM 12826 / AT1271) TaxID=1122195 RepID=A0A1M4XY85_MARH1|nr:mannosylglucosylglycerate synthase [Marinitoga hydrogenitolerans]SHE98400.1 Glycosyltransferase involved in cell wall bisynthesis [Marinitoga hydrogenitolerans DSM 16785]